MQPYLLVFIFKKVYFGYYTLLIESILFPKMVNNRD